MIMLEKKFMNNELEIELISYIDTKQNTWFKGKDVAKILGYHDTDQALKGLYHSSPVNLVEFFQLLALNRYGLS